MGIRVDAAKGLIIATITLISRIDIHRSSAKHMD